jgi:hypothetical protein
MESSENTWKAVETHGKQWKHMESSGNTWKAVETHGKQWKHMESSGNRGMEQRVRQGAGDGSASKPS